MTSLFATYSSWGAARRDAAALRHGAFLKAAVEVDQFAQIDVRIELPDGEAALVKGEVVSVVPGSAVAVQWKPESHEVVARLLAKIDAQPQTPAPIDAVDEPAVVALEDDDDERGERNSDKAELPIGDRESLQAQVESMTVQQKRTAALHAHKDMRLLLIRDLNKSIHPFVVKNPAITLDEIEQISRLTSVNPEVLHIIGANRDWTRSSNVVRNLVKNPKMPMPDAVALVDKLAISDVRAMAKSPSVRGPIQQACRKKINPT
jgi:hypothetical protein